MTTTSTPRRRTSAGSNNSHHPRTPPSQHDQDKPVRLRLKLSPTSKKNEEAANKNTQAEPPGESSHPPLCLPSQTLSASIDMCAPIIRPLKRSREHDISESDISVLDLGPSLTRPDINHLPPGDPTVAATRILEAELRSRRPLEPYPNPPRPRPNERDASYAIQRRRAEESESEPVSSGSNVSPTDESLPPISLRRNQQELHLDLQMRTGLRAPPRRRVRVRTPVTGDIHLLGYGWGFGGHERVQDRSDFYIVESDSEGYIHSTSAAVHGSAEDRPSTRAARRRAGYPVGSWDRRSSDLFTTGLSHYEQTLDLFPEVEVDDMVN